MLETNQFNQILGESLENWIPAKRPEAKIIRGKNCVLEPLDSAIHAKALFSNLNFENSGESWTYLPYGPFSNLDDFTAWVRETMSDSDTLLFAILNNEGEPIGLGGYLRINPGHGVIEVGHLHYSKRLKKSPAATEAMYLLMKYAFDELGYRRYEWKCNALNQPSRSAALRLGFTFEGIFRQSFVFKNRNRDTAWYSIIDSEWPHLKIKFINWLDDRNFDEKGNQRMSLKDISGGVNI